MTWARNFDEATAALSSQRFSALFADVRLPGRSGFDVLEAFRESHPRIPALVLTGYFEESDSRRACELEAQYVAKPISVGALRAFVERIPFDQASPNPFSPHEREILKRLLRGETVKAIAVEMGAAASTIRSLVRRAKRKVAAASRFELLSMAAGYDLSPMLSGLQSRPPR